MIEDSLQSHLCKGRALCVFVGSNFLCEGYPPGKGDGNPSLLGQLVLDVFVVPCVQLGADKNDGNIGCVMSNLGPPLQKRG